MKRNAFVDSIRDSVEVRLLADAYPSYLSYVDRDYRYRFVNKVYERVFDIPREKILDELVEDVWGAEAFATLKANLDRALAGETFTVEMAFEGRYVATTYVPHARDDGDVLGVLIFTQDVTELQASRAAAIQTERMASLGRLVAGLLHELNTPLGVLASNIDLMHRAVEAGNLAAAPGTIDTLRAPNQESIARMRSVIGHLRSFAALDEAETQRFDVHEGLDSALALLDHRLGDEVEISTLYGELPNVVGQRAELNQVFMSLLMNAVDALDGRGSIEIRTEHADGKVHVAIADNGKGISPELIDTLFEPAFVRTSERVKTGLGLFVSDNIIKTHGGEIRVESTLGAGSKFTVVLPVPTSGVVA